MYTQCKFWREEQAGWIITQGMAFSDANTGIRKGCFFRKSSFYFTHIFFPSTM